MAKTPSIYRVTYTYFIAMGSLGEKIQVHLIHVMRWYRSGTKNLKIKIYLNFSKAKLEKVTIILILTFLV